MKIKTKTKTLSLKWILRTKQKPVYLAALRGLNHVWTPQMFTCFLTVYCKIHGSDQRTKLSETLCESVPDTFCSPCCSGVFLNSAVLVANTSGCSLLLSFASLNWQSKRSDSFGIITMPAKAAARVMAFLPYSYLCYIKWSVTVHIEKTHSKVHAAP